MADHRGWKLPAEKEDEPAAPTPTRRRRLCCVTEVGFELRVPQRH